jgi:hypothetical protein
MKFDFKNAKSRKYQVNSNLDEESFKKIGKIAARHSISLSTVVTVLVKTALKEVNLGAGRPRKVAAPIVQTEPVEPNNQKTGFGWGK